MKTNDLTIYVALAAFLFWQYGQKPTNAVVSAPSAAMQQQVAEVKAVAAGKPAAKVAAGLFSAAADVVKRDSTRLTNTAQVAAWLSDANFLRVQGTDLVGSLPGFSKAVDAAIKSAIGDKPTALTPELRAKLVEVLEGVAWACK